MTHGRFENYPQCIKKEVSFAPLFMFFLEETKPFSSSHSFFSLFPAWGFL